MFFLGCIKFLNRLKKILMMNKLFFIPFLLGVTSFTVHFLIVLFLYPNLVELIIVTHVFLLAWSTIYMLSLKKIHLNNPKLVISGFMVLTTLKMLLSIVFLIILKNYLSILIIPIIINFFIAFFIHLFLQVSFSIRLLR